VKIEIREEPMTFLEEHGEVSIAFQVDRTLRASLIRGGLGGVGLEERPIDEPYLKDYDAIRGEGPSRLASRFDLANWGLLGAHREGTRVGGAVLAFDTDGVSMLEGRRDLAVLWDLRVQPEHRRGQVGRALFAAAESWAKARHCVQLVVETQNVNVAASRFYAAMGCELRALDRFAYPDLPDEVQLLWAKTL
jgi:GNAT superfamily N-acetyltransferase